MQGPTGSERSMLGMEEHPDIAEMRARYDRAAQSSTAQFVSGLAFMLGLYLAISPWVIGFNGRATLTVNNLIVGIAMAVLAVGFTSAYGRTHGVTWVMPVLGVWTIIAPWVLPEHGATTSVIITNVITGALIIACGAACVGIGMMSSRRHRLRRA
ncbi:SPW repeat protein [Nonomuraea pusilla]|uniref:SPW repeat protein n=1 Tax=Nonomuraea pusilla TaxID=46177 RepID=UPI003333ADF4